MYDASFNLDELYHVASEMSSYTGKQEYATSRILSETNIMRGLFEDAVSTLERRLEEENRILAALEEELSHAKWKLSNCKETDDEGRTTREYEYWSNVVEELQDAVINQCAVIKRVEEALTNVKHLANDSFVRINMIQQRTISFRSSVGGVSEAAADAIRCSASVMSGYWDLKL